RGVLGRCTTWTGRLPQGRAGGLPSPGSQPGCACDGSPQWHVTPSPAFPAGDGGIAVTTLVTLLAERDLNPRPLPYQGSALTELSYPPAIQPEAGRIYLRRIGTSSRAVTGSMCFARASDSRTK